MVGDRRKRIKISVNVPEKGDWHKETLCPMCIFRNEENKMHIDEKTKAYVCKTCGYMVPPQLDPVIGSTLEAGNEEMSMRPYGKSVNIHKKRTFSTDNDIYKSAYEAWNSNA